jgi:sensor c-di-GMP phosphodiesterase-like protein
MTRYNQVPFEDDPIDNKQSTRQIQRRIDREVVIVKNNEEQEADITENAVDSKEEHVELNEGHTTEVKRNKSIVQHIITGSLLTDGAVPYHRYFIAIAVMCFVSIFLTFLSLNTSNEYRRKERTLTTLHERSVIKEEQRYGLSSKSAVTSRLKEYNIELVDLSKNSRLIEK